MKDDQIVALYFERSESAIEETTRKYGGTLIRIARNISGSDEDAEECVNDAYLRAWNSIPPEKPAKLGAYICRIVRNISLNRYAKNRALKRYAGVEETFEELSELIPDPESLCAGSESAALKDAINRFVGSLPARNRKIFVQRYFYMMPVSDIAKCCAVKPGTVRVALMRMRQSLRVFLEKEDIEI